MPYTLSYSAAETLYTVTVSGRVAIQEFGDVLRQVVEGELGPSTGNLMWDFRGADLRDLRFNDEMELLQIRRGMNAKRGNPRVAFLVGTDTAYGMVRMWMSLLDSEPEITQTVGLFRDEAEAVAWLHSPSPA